MKVAADNAQQELHSMVIDVHQVLTLAETLTLSGMDIVVFACLDIGHWQKENV